MLQQRHTTHEHLMSTDRSLMTETEFARLARKEREREVTGLRLEGTGCCRLGTPTPWQRQEDTVQLNRQPSDSPPTTSECALV